VYNRAMYTADLLNARITSQGQVDAIDTLLHSDWETTKRTMTLRYCGHVIRFLEEICRDRWYILAWVIQEAVCAGLKLVLAFRRSPELRFQSKFRHGYKCEREDRPYHSLDDLARGLDLTLICINLGGFCRILDVMQNLVLRDFKAVIQAAGSLHPRAFKANTFPQDTMTYSEDHYGKRPTVNAAGALTLLKHRECYFEFERLAIVANMCDYDFGARHKSYKQSFSFTTSRNLGIRVE
jgi:hypothetical protein